MSISLPMCVIVIVIILFTLLYCYSSSLYRDRNLYCEPLRTHLPFFFQITIKITSNKCYKVNRNDKNFKLIMINFCRSYMYMLEKHALSHQNSILGHSFVQRDKFKQDCKIKQVILQERFPGSTIFCIILASDFANHYFFLILFKKF